MLGFCVSIVIIVIVDRSKVGFLVDIGSGEKLFGFIKVVVLLVEGAGGRVVWVCDGLRVFFCLVFVV